ncbi:unnamed protein product [Ambrosiozyma monospora]|uniref:Unnamed protein product n=1 Tax=Ambrosiozyma monospora TaxID=43982 RepID=A0ACB5TXM6_AMBMO|nr:unnamed protein product [Ambrosiozyma monospora]
MWSIRTLILISICLHKIVLAFLIPSTFRVARDYYGDPYQKAFILGCVSSLQVLISWILNISIFKIKDKIHHIYTIFYTFASFVLTTVFTIKTIIGRNDTTMESTVVYDTSGFSYDYEPKSIPSELAWLIWFTIALTVFIFIANCCTFLAFAQRKLRKEDRHLEIHREKTSIRLCLIANVFLSIVILSLSGVILWGKYYSHYYPSYNRYYVITIVFAFIDIVMCVSGYWIKLLSFHITLSLLLPPFFGISVFKIVNEYRGSYRYILFITISVLVGIAEFVQLSLIVFSVKESRRQYHSAFNPLPNS